MPLPTENLLDHVKWLRRAVRAAGAELLFAGETMQAFVRSGERHVVLHPQFLMSRDGVTLRTPQLHDESAGFLGWLPYPSKQWPIASDRNAFKRYAAEMGLPVPRFWAIAEPTLTDVVIRRVHPSFEPHLAGPFRSAAEQKLDADPAEYYERYVEGDAVTAWFWDGQPICAERFPVPFVVGDGACTVGELVVRGANRGGQVTPAELHGRLAECDVLVRFHGMTLASVLRSGEKLVVGLGYGSLLSASRDRHVVDIATAPDWNLLPLMRKAGQALLAAVPEEDRRATLFAVNATVDGEGRPWLIDVDASPRVHPLMYAAILASLLGTETPP